MNIRGAPMCPGIDEERFSLHDARRVMEPPLGPRYGPFLVVGVNVRETSFFCSYTIHRYILLQRSWLVFLDRNDTYKENLP